MNDRPTFRLIYVPTYMNTDVTENECIAPAQ